MKKRSGIYLLPNLFTTGAMFFGFYAIILAMSENYIKASILIFISMVLDSLDGRVARMTSTESEFGAQYDSLADLVSFGVAPALVAYKWSLFELGRIGWLLAFIYLVTVALRLARFNIQPAHSNRYFIGLPCPSAAGFVAIWVWIGHQYGLSGKGIAILTAFIVVTVAALMVSNIYYRSFKDVDFKERIKLTTIVLVALIYAVLTYSPAHVIFAVGVIYILSGPIMSFVRIRSKRKKNISRKND